MWNGSSPTITPFEPWRPFRGGSAPKGALLPWYSAYNASKHSRQREFKQANLWTLIEAVAALVIVVTAQFKTVTFEAGPDLLATGSGPHSREDSIGELFRIKYPDDWAEDEMYDFDWSALKTEPDRFDKIDYKTVPI